MKLKIERTHFTTLVQFKYQTSHRMTIYKNIDDDTHLHSSPIINECLG